MRYMKACEDLDMGCDLTTQIPPLAAALSDSLLFFRCSACFSPLNRNTHSTNTLHHIHPCEGQCRGSVIYCTQHCSDRDFNSHIQSGECHLLSLIKQEDFIPNAWRGPKTFAALGGTCDLRAALRLLALHRQHQHSGSFSNPIDHLIHVNRGISNLMTNRQRLLHSNAVSNFHRHEDYCETDTDTDTAEMTHQIREGARLMALARQHAGVYIGDTEYNTSQNDVQRLEEEVLCQVITNGVQVQVDEEMSAQETGLFRVELQCVALGTAVYGPLFSWCNHSCRPNACYRFVLKTERGGLDSEAQKKVAPGNGVLIEPGNEDFTIVSSASETMELQNQFHGPRVVLRTIRKVLKGEQIFITYTDLMQPKKTRQVELWLKYRFICHCERCDASPQCYIDQILEDINTINMGRSIPESNCNETTDIDMIMDKLECGIAEFVSDGDPDTCCRTLEYILGTVIAPKDVVTGVDQLLSGHSFFKIHPLHRLCLDAYTALASAYRILATEMLHCSFMKCQSSSGAFILSTSEPSASADNAEPTVRDHNSDVYFDSPFIFSLERGQCLGILSELNSLSGSTRSPDLQAMAQQGRIKAVENSQIIKASNFNRVAAAYTLLLAGAVQHFFLSGEQGLIMTAARFWMNAGEALLKWIIGCECKLPISKMNHYPCKNWPHLMFGSVSRCIKCDCLFLNENVGGTPVLLYTKTGNSYDHEEGLTNADRYPLFLRASASFLSCMNKCVKLVWPSLHFGLSLLEAIIDPIDYSWLAESQGQQVLKQFFLQDEVERKCICINIEDCNCRTDSYSEMSEGMSVSNKDDAYSRCCMKKRKLFAVQCAVHCLCYSKYLIEICYGPDYFLVYYIQNLLYSINHRKC